MIDTSPTVNFDNVLSVLRKNPQSTVQSGPRALDQSFRAQTVVLPPPTCIGPPGDTKEKIISIALTNLTILFLIFSDKRN